MTPQEKEEAMKRWKFFIYMSLAFWAGWFAFYAVKYWELYWQLSRLIARGY